MRRNLVIMKNCKKARQSTNLGLFLDMKKWSIANQLILAFCDTPSKYWMIKVVELSFYIPHL